MNSMQRTFIRNYAQTKNQDAPVMVAVRLGLSLQEVEAELTRLAAKGENNGAVLTKAEAGWAQALAGRRF